MNLPTIIVCLILAAIVVWIIYTMIRNKKQGKSCCGGNCSGCIGGCKCKK